MKVRKFAGALTCAALLLLSGCGLTSLHVDGEVDIQTDEELEKDKKE